jgi:hypothetical protein
MYDRSQVNEIKQRITLDYEGRLKARTDELDAQVARDNAEM